MQIDSLDRIEYDLTQWGRWANQDGRPTLTELDLNRSNEGDPDISDDHAGKIDSAVAQLKLNHKQLGKAVIVTYRYHYNRRMLAKYLDCSVSSAQEMLKSGLAWVDGQVHEP